MPSIPIHLTPPIGAEAFPRCGEPVTAGIPFPRGMAFDAARVFLSDATGRQVPLQTRVLERWADGSIRWLLIDFRADLRDATPTTYRLGLTDESAKRVRSEGATPRHWVGGEGAESVRVRMADDSITVDTGAAQFELRRGEGWPLARVVTSQGFPANLDHSGLTIDFGDGMPQRARVTAVAVEEEGPLRTTVAWGGWIGADQKAVAVCGHLDFYAQSTVVRISLTLRNPQRTRHAGNFWELGDPQSVLFKDANLTLPLLPGTGPVDIVCSPERGSPARRMGPLLEIYQESSGGEQWRSEIHRNRDGLVPHQMRGYVMRGGGRIGHGLRATPLVTVHREGLELSIAMEWFWQNFPKALEVTERALIVRLFPQQYPDLHELQGGEQKTHELAVAFGPDRVTAVPLAWYRDPVLPHADPTWYCGGGELPYTVPASEDVDPRYDALVRAAIESRDDSFLHKRERIDEYGWRHFGDIYADHESVFYRGRGPIVSHYNNQYDVIAGMAVQFMRSGDRRWWEQMRELAAHVVDIDIYHTDQDKSAYNHGLFWHTAHYVDAARSTHRSYPRVAGVTGGGPGNEHNYNTGLMLHAFLTGDPCSREAAVALAQWVVDMDDGSQTPFRWVASGDTGLASSTDSVEFHSAGRGAGNSIVVLLNGFRLTGRQEFLAKAEQLIRRCISPADDIETLDLLNAERRWSYTVFLQALARYLLFKAERGECDAMYAYARNSLLHYARWLVAHEYPYLDRPEALEFPTETWSAQDMRKSEVLLQAALHLGNGEEAERRQLVERAAFFYESSISALQRARTRTMARPVAILLSNGLSYGWFASACGGDVARLERVTLPRPDEKMNTPWARNARPAFVPQKCRALGRVKTLLKVAAVIAITMGLAAVGYAATAWFSF